MKVHQVPLLILYKPICVYIKHYVFDIFINRLIVTIYNIDEHKII